MSTKHPFLNPELPLEERVEDLVSRLTLVEKVGQLMHENPAVDRLGDVRFEARVRIDTPKEREYYEHGGILHYVLRGLLKAK